MPKRTAVQVAPFWGANSRIKQPNEIKFTRKPCHGSLFTVLEFHWREKLWLFQKLRFSLKRRHVRSDCFGAYEQYKPVLLLSK